MFKRFSKTLVFGLIATMAIPAAHAQGIRFGGDDEQSGLRQSQPQREQSEPNSPMPEISQREQAEISGRGLLREAEKLRARFRQGQSEAAGTSDEHRYGFVVAFMDTQSLMNPRYIKQLNALENMDGIKFLLFQSEYNEMPNLSDTEIKRLENMEPLMARDDRGGKIANDYNVTKFPTILYETPNHDVIPFYVPSTLDRVFARINAEIRKQARR